ncbi:ATPase component of ABC transporters with duplicated ATPase domain [Desulfosporosinus orientis DSM 765]|uniref:ATPase component of ABC transporters with duplicated ATPase domain n=1 Tax=Desulfosporosinus orientis (strain ATCC 19365 / DSM 765 / NCIMB 8382 / VKM B-1628 / Singapore I) TaxID=768706 RepID=G7WIJ6_DESOD|nr:ABC-F family ATP-binding cassette domain-containing protein [Desulfosporosinus orientis]AET69070.1 ATPase component of ABC transporters with duplicated ATPase domain [Desulfosporosinus orientis DSM 765]
MSILVCRNCGVDISGEPLFRQVSLALEKGEKAALVGPNGAGKTTLLRACLGDVRLESGEAQIFGTCGYLPQTPIVEDEGNVFECVIQERADLLQMQEQLRELEGKMASATGDKVMEQYAALTEAFERQGGYALEALVRRILAGLGLEGEMNSQVARLSGGQKTRLALCKLLLRGPELLILDEPTNHLDIAAIEWLEGYLRDYSGALLIVSHDRYFLDRTVSRVFCLENGEIKGYTGNYSEYELLRAIEAKTTAREAERLAKKIAKLEEYVRRNKAGVNSKQARGRESQLQKLKPIQVSKADRGMSISMGSGGRSGNRVLALEDLAISFGTRTLFANVQLDLRRGDRVALLGKNGIGKTTLLKAILEQAPYQGRIRLGANVKIAYYSQEHEDLGTSGTVMDEIRNVSKLKDPEIRNLLARYGFRKEEVFKQISVLSGGEKSRLALCKLFLEQGNLLLLDEPTNHLDAETRGLLEEALQEYDGTVLAVSHDRYFLDKVVTKIAELTPEGLLLFEGDYTGFKEYKQQEEMSVSPLEQTVKQSSSDQQESRQLAREKKRMKQLEAEIEELENALEALEAELSQVNTNYELAMKLHEECEEIKKRRDLALEEWIAGND